MVKIQDIRVRDPFIFVENNAYYLLGTTGDDCWNAGSDLMLYRSENLLECEPLGRMVSGARLQGYTNVWAPEMHRYNGRYYLIVSLFCKEEGRGSMIFSAEKITDEFTPLTGEYVTPRGWGCLDATLFVWQGKPYLVFSNEWTTPITNDGDGALFAAELSPDLRGLAGRPVKIVSGKYCGFAKEIGSGNCRGFVAEGPYLVQEGQKIALYWSTVTENGYCVVKSLADHIFGDYKTDKFIFDKDGGHAMLFTDLSGRQKLVLHYPNVSPHERIRFVDL